MDFKSIILLASTKGKGQGSSQTVTQLQTGLLGQSGQLLHPVPRESSRDKERIWTEGLVVHQGRDRGDEWGLGVACHWGSNSAGQTGTQHPQDRLCPLLAETSGRSITLSLNQGTSLRKKW